MKPEYRFKQDLFIKVIIQVGGRFSSQHSRAAKLHLNQSTLSRIENGDRDPKIEELVRVCNVTDFAPSDFFEISDEP